jgi:hypothetical protein
MSHEGKHRRNEYYPKSFNNFHNVWVCENYVGQCPLPSVYLIYKMFQKWNLLLTSVTVKVIKMKNV